MQKAYVDSAVFGLIGLAYAVLVTFSARRFRSDKPVKWYVIVDRYSFSMLALLMAFASFRAGNARSVADFPAVAFYLLIVVFGAVSIAAAIMRGREFRKGANDKRADGQEEK